MATVRGLYYDGRRSAQRRVVLTLDGDLLVVAGDGVERSEPLAALTVAPRLGTVRRSIRFADGALCELTDDRFLDGILRRQGKGGAAAALHRWERSIPRALVALVLTVVVIGAFVAWGIPSLARRAAFAVPPATEVSLGRDTLVMLDKVLFAPSKLPEPRRQELARLFGQMTTQLPWAGGYRIEFRSGRRLGANALALPSGIIVVTDELVNLAKHDEELAAVLAHEMGHVVHRHGLRMVIQDSVVTVAVMLITGDVLSASSVAAALPAVLVRGGYSREFEREADVYAYRYMKEHGMDPASFISMLEKLEGRHRGAAGPGLLSTHPSYEQRARIFRGQR